jgi:hypothetical protein
VRAQVSYPYKTTYKITVSHILISIVLDDTRGDKKVSN